MTITELEAWAVSMGLEAPSRIAYETVSRVTNVFVRVKTNRKIVGLGCAASDQPITGETPESVLKDLNDIAPLFVHSDPLRLTMLIERLKPHLQGHPSTLAAIDMALYDILGKTSSLSLWKLLGGFRDRIKTSVTIGILPERDRHSCPVMGGRRF